MLSPQVLARGPVSRALPSALADSTSNDAGLRTSRYGEQFAYAPLIGKYALADEGSYFVARTPTPGAPVAGAGAKVTETPVQAPSESAPVASAAVCTASVAFEVE